MLYERCEWGEILTAMENRERRGKEETPLEDSKGSICECIYTSRTSKDFSYLILSYDEFALRAPSSRNIDAYCGGTHNNQILCNPCW